MRVSWTSVGTKYGANRILAYERTQFDIPILLIAPVLNELRIFRVNLVLKMISSFWRWDTVAVTVTVTVTVTVPS